MSYAATLADCNAKITIIFVCASFYCINIAFCSQPAATGPAGTAVRDWGEVLVEAAPDWFWLGRLRIGYTERDYS